MSQKDRQMKLSICTDVMADLSFTDMLDRCVELGVDIIEAGFAAASPGDEEAVGVVSGEVEGPVFCSLSRARTRLT